MSIIAVASCARMLRNSRIRVNNTEYVFRALVTSPYHFTTTTTAPATGLPCMVVALCFWVFSWFTPMLRMEISCGMRWSRFGLPSQAVMLLRAVWLLFVVVDILTVIIMSSVLSLVAFYSYQIYSVCLVFMKMLLLLYINTLQQGLHLFLMPRNTL